MGLCVSNTPYCHSPASLQLPISVEAPFLFWFIATLGRSGMSGRSAHHPVRVGYHKDWYPRFCLIEAL